MAPGYFVRRKVLEKSCCRGNCAINQRVGVIKRRTVKKVDIEERLMAAQQRLQSAADYNRLIEGEKKFTLLV